MRDNGRCFAVIAVALAAVGGCGAPSTPPAGATSTPASGSAASRDVCPLIPKPEAERIVGRPLSNAIPTTALAPTTTPTETTNTAATPAYPSAPACQYTVPGSSSKLTVTVWDSAGVFDAALAAEGKQNADQGVGERSFRGNYDSIWTVSKAQTVRVEPALFLKGSDLATVEDAKKIAQVVVAHL